MGKKIFLFIFLLCFLSSNAKADWVEDWLNDTVATYSSPQSFEGQKRGYVTFGSFSGREIMTSDRIFTFTPPKIKLGCGGIDIFGGGFAYLNFDYLVDKMQRIISAAPAFAFDYALATICSQCSEIMKSLDSITEILNQIQLDDCALAKKIGVWSASKLVNDYQGALDSLAKTASAKLATVKGWAESYKQWIDELQGRSPPGELTESENQALNENCPSDILEMVNKGSLIDYVYKQHFASVINDDSLKALLRGFLGDVIFEEKDDAYIAYYIPGCGGPNGEILKAFTTGAMKVKVYDSSTGTYVCRDFTTEYPSAKTIVALVTETMQSAYNKMLTNTSLTASEENLIKVLPTRIYDYMRQLYMYNAPDFAVNDLAGVSSYGLGYVLLISVYGECQKAILEIQEMLSVCKSQMGNGQFCFLCESGADLIDALRKFTNFTMDAMKKVHQEWMAEQNQLRIMAELIKVLKDISRETIRIKLTQGNKQAK